MEISNKRLYHLHKNNEYDHMWVVGNTIDNTGADFLNKFTLLDYTNDYYALFGDERVSFTEVLNHYIKNVPDSQTMVSLLKSAKDMINDLCIVQRERALEEVRLQYYPHLISRRQAIWACDGLGLDWWANVFSDRQAYEIEVNGDVFASSHEYLPKLGISYSEALERAHEYWNPNLDDISGEKIEYLIQGEIKVLKKV